jgi:hypothetical protein
MLCVSLMLACIETDYLYCRPVCCCFRCARRIPHSVKIERSGIYNFREFVFRKQEHVSKNRQFLSIDTSFPSPPPIAWTLPN